MPKLIDANELWGQIYKLSHNHKWKNRTNIAFNKCLDAIQFFPTVDAEPVRHGHWDDMGDFESCSVCNGTHLKEYQTYYGKCLWVKMDYCPHCGAKMDEVEDDAK